jgi:hypothetical protein
MYRVDYFDAFSPVARLVTVCVLVLVAVHCNWSFHQLNVENVFLYGDLKEKSTCSSLCDLRLRSVPRLAYYIRQFMDSSRV